MRAPTSLTTAAAFGNGWPENSRRWAGPGVLMCHGRGSGCGLGPEHDVVAEGVEAADQALGGAVLVDAVEVVGAEVGEGDGAPQHVEGGDQDLVRDGDGRLLGPHARPQSVELVAQVAAPGPGT